MAITLDDLTEPAPEPSWLDWNDDGFVILKGVLPEDLMSAYEREWWAYNGDTELCHANQAGNITFMGQAAKRPGGWPDATPYMRHEHLRALATCPEIMEPMRELIGEPAGLHLNLTGWVSTERDWHQDTYLNPPHAQVGDHYVAVWMALDTIDPRSGPFQMIPGSHRWFRLTEERIKAAMPADQANSDAWPSLSETFLTPLLEKEIASRGVPIIDYLPNRGDVLFWHTRLVHRGSKATAPGMTRRALISHYSGIDHRKDMPKAAQLANGGWIFPLPSARTMV